MKRCLNFGCGVNFRDSSKKIKWDNVDVQNSPKLKKSFDFNKFPYPLKSDNYDYVYAKSIIEHLWDLDKVFDELWRICKNGAIIEIGVPHYSNKGAYDDIQHVHFFNDRTFYNLVYDKRKIENLKKFELIYQKINPSPIGKFLPKKIRLYLSYFINGLHSKIWVKLRVIKE